MKRIIAATALLIGISTYAQSAPQVFSLPNSTGAAQWVELGTFNDSTLMGTLDIKIIANDGYYGSATVSNDQMSYIHFASSLLYGSQNTTNFAGTSWWYQTGVSTSVPSQVEWVANAPGNTATAFTLFAYFGSFTNNLFYVVDISPAATWTNVASGGQANPGSASATVLPVLPQMYVGSTATFAGNVGIGTTSTASLLTLNAPPGSYTALQANYNGTQSFALNVGASSNGWTLYDYASGSWTSGITQKSGNVGIGTTSPSQTLEVNGTAQIDNVLTPEGGAGKKERLLGIPYGMELTVPPSGFHGQGLSTRP
jgi:hypothetical protein